MEDSSFICQIPVTYSSIILFITKKPLLENWAMGQLVILRVFKFNVFLFGLMLMKLGLICLLPIVFTFRLGLLIRSLMLISLKLFILAAVIRFDLLLANLHRLCFLLHWRKFLCFSQSRGSFILVLNGIMKISSAALVPPLLARLWRVWTRQSESGRVILYISSRDFHELIYIMYIFKFQDFEFMCAFCFVLDLNVLYNGKQNWSTLSCCTYAPQTTSTFLIQMLQFHFLQSL